ncbi:unnamed protein product, partial [marine sediment metagenome]
VKANLTVTVPAYTYLHFSYLQLLTLCLHFSYL